jgi:hypothetical protein
VSYNENLQVAVVLLVFRRSRSLYIAAHPLSMALSARFYSGSPAHPL